MVATSKRFSFALRLDDGTLISGCKKHASEEAAPVVCLKPEEAFQKGYLQEADLLRAQAHLCEVHAKLPEAGPLKSVSTGTKRSLDSVLEVGQAVSGKRSRSTGGVVAPANGYHDTAAAHAHPPKGIIESPRSLPAPPPPAPAAAAPVRPAAPVPPPRPVADPSIASFGMATVNKIIKMLGKDSWIFTNPVNAAAVPDYYDIIKNPICLADIKQRLSQGYYHNMAAFYEDMYLLVSNCFTYNKIGTPVHTQGQRIEKMFNGELRKIGQGLLIRQIKKQPRTAASRGGHRVVDDEDDDDDYRPAAPSKRPGSQRVPPPAAKAKSRPGAAAPKPAGKAGAGVARTKSVNSYKAFQPLPEDKQAQLAEALSDEAVLTEKMEGVVEILQRANELGASEDGEVELDLTILSPQTVWQLYEYIFGPQQAAAPERAQRSGSGFQLEQDSDYDPMGDSDEDL